MVATVRAKPTLATDPPATTGGIIDSLWKHREKKRKLEAEIVEVEALIKTDEDKLMERLNSEGLDKATGTKASVSITSTVTASVEDWDAFWVYVIKNKYTHLLQRRVSDPAYRELLEHGKKVTGVVPFVKKRVNLRSV